MAHYLLRFLQQDMLLLWDRNFLSYRTLSEVRQRKAHLLARIKKNLIFEPIRWLKDGSDLAKLYRSAADRRKDRDGIPVRIIEYTLDDPGRAGTGQPHRLLTTLLDEDLAGRSVDPFGSPTEPFVGPRDHQLNLLEGHGLPRLAHRVDGRGEGAGERGVQLGLSGVWVEHVE